MNKRISIKEISLKSLFGKLILLWNTIKWLKPIQIFSRIFFRLYKPTFTLSMVPARRKKFNIWHLPCGRAPTLINCGEFIFLNIRGTLDSNGWHDGSRSSLWRYNQHYFDDLNATGSRERYEWHHDFLLRWVRENAPFAGLGWEPYPTSLRVVNWIKWSFAGNQLPEESIRSLALQSEWLSRRLEYHLLGNHLFSNAKALIFAGSFFKGPESERWLKTGLRILRREVPEQILRDGGHFERSVMYHALALEDMLDLINVLNCLNSSGVGDRPELRELINSALVEWPIVVNQMIKWLNAMRHPDGEISFFNDTAVGVAPDCESILDYAERLGLQVERVCQSSVLLSESGYIRMESSNACLLFDAAPVGPDYLPGHAHADTLSFELSLFGRRLFVNSGTSEYGLGPERLRQRSTAAHNTIEVNSENSSEVWSGFRVARRAYPYDVSLKNLKGVIEASAWHNGYRRLSPSIQVGRTIRLLDCAIEIEDVIAGKYKKAVARFFCHPKIKIASVDEGVLTLSVFTDNDVRLLFDGAKSVKIEESTWHPQFGMVEPNHCVVVDIEGVKLTTHVDWSRH